METMNIKIKNPKITITDALNALWTPLISWLISGKNLRKRKNLNILVTRKTNR